MSVLGIVFIKDGIIMSSDSRLTATKTVNGTKQVRALDKLPKTFLISDIGVGISYCGNVRVEDKLFHDFIREFVKNNIKKEDTVCTVKEKIFSIQNRKGTYFVIGGYLDKIPYVYYIHDDTCIRANIGNDNNLRYSSIILGGDEFPQQYYEDSIQGKIKLELLDVRNGITLAENFVVTGIQNADSCGGSINTLVIQEGAAYWHQCHCDSENIKIG